MQFEDAATRQDLADWSQPIIVDYLFELYARQLGAGHHSIRALALSHGRMWRLLILGNVEKFDSARREVVGIARLATLKSSFIAEIDQAMLTELMDVVVTRFSRMPAQARGYSHILLGAAMRLAPLGVGVVAARAEG